MFIDEAPFLQSVHLNELELLFMGSIERADQIVERFARSRRLGHDCELDRFVTIATEFASSMKIEIICQLVQIEIEHRWRELSKATSDVSCENFDESGKLIEKFLTRYPQLKSDDCIERLVCAEYRIRLAISSKPEKESFYRRFPSCYEHLSIMFAQMDSELADIATVAHSSSGTQNGVDQDSTKASRLFDRFCSDGDRIKYFGEYELIEEIARGGMGIVYKAKQLTLNRVVALKMIRSGEYASAIDVHRFKEEALAAAVLSHPGIVQIYETGEHDGLRYFTMEFVDGISLSQKIQSGPLHPSLAVQVMVKVTDAVAYAHSQGLIHRDIKPSNVLLDHDGTPKVTDFGLAKRLDSSLAMTLTGEVLGTPSYMAPEQALGLAKSISERTDVYSIGATLYALITGRPPFQASSIHEILSQVINREPIAPTQLDSSIPRDLETICLRCLRKDPKQRFESVLSLKEDLIRFSEGRPIRSRRVGVWERGILWCGRNPQTTALLTATTLSLIGGFVLALAYARDATSHANQLKQSLNRIEKKAYASAVQSAYNSWRNGRFGESESILNRTDSEGFEKRLISNLLHGQRTIREGNKQRYVGSSGLGVNTGLFASLVFGEMEVQSLLKNELPRKLSIPDYATALKGRMSPNGRVFFVGGMKVVKHNSGEGYIHIPLDFSAFDTETGKLIRSFSNANGRFWISDSGENLVLFSNQKLQLIESRTGVVKAEFDAAYPVKIDFSGNERILAVAMNNGTETDFRIFDLTTGGLIHKQTQRIADLGAIQLSYLGEVLYVLTERSVQRIKLDEEQWKPETIVKEVDSDVSGILFSRDESKLLMKHGVDPVRFSLLQLSSGRWIRRSDSKLYRASVEQLGFVDEDSRILSMNEFGEVVLWSTSPSPFFANSAVSDMGFSLKNRIVLTNGEAQSQEVVQQDTRNGLNSDVGSIDLLVGQSTKYIGNRSVVGAMVNGKEMDIVFSSRPPASLNKTGNKAPKGQYGIWLCDPYNKTCELAIAIDNEVVSMAIDRSSDLLVLLCDRKVLTFDLNQRSLQHEYPLPDGFQGLGHIVSEESSRVVVLGKFSLFFEIRLKDRMAKLVQTEESIEANGEVVSLSSSRHELYTATRDRIQVREKNTLRVNRLFSRWWTEVSCLSTTQDGRVVVSGGKNGDITFWDTEDGQPILTLDDFREEVKAIGFSTDERYMFAIGTEGFRIWDAGKLAQ